MHLYYCGKLPDCSRFPHFKWFLTETYHNHFCQQNKKSIHKNYAPSSGTGKSICCCPTCSCGKNSSCCVKKSKKKKKKEPTKTKEESVISTIAQRHTAATTTTITSASRYCNKSLEKNRLAAIIAAQYTLVPVTLVPPVLFHI